MGEIVKIMQLRSIIQELYRIQVRLLIQVKVRSSNLLVGHGKMIQVLKRINGC